MVQNTPAEFRTAGYQEKQRWILLSSRTEDGRIANEVGWLWQRLRTYTAWCGGGTKRLGPDRFTLALPFTIDSEAFSLTLSDYQQRETRPYSTKMKAVPDLYSE